MALKKYHFKVERRPRTQYRKVEGLSKRTNIYQWREKQLEKLPPVAEEWNFLSQEEFDQLPVSPWFDLHGRVIPNHHQVPAHLRNTKRDPQNAVCRVTRCRKRHQAAEKKESALRAPLPEAVYLLPTDVAKIPSCKMYALDETVEQAIATAPTVVRQAALVIKDIDSELHEHANTVHGIKDLVLAQNRDVHVIAIKESIDQVFR